MRAGLDHPPVWFLRVQRYAVDLGHYADTAAADDQWAVGVIVPDEDESAVCKPLETVLAAIATLAAHKLLDTLRN